MAGRQIIVDIIGDSTGFNKATASATQNAGKFGNILTGIGQGVGQKIFGLLEEGIGKVTGALEDSVKKAEEYEVASTKLDAALKSNVAGWNGNRESLNGYLDRQTALGFSVTETTNSFAQLVAATGDVAKAQKFQAAAMDLARFKGISLADATDALTKVEGGSYRVLKSLGIEMHKGASQAEVLGAVMKVAGGQASAFMNTAVGKMDEANAKIDDMQVKVGQKLIPVIGALADKLSAAMDIMNGDTIANNLVQQNRDFIALGLTATTYRSSLAGVKEQYDSLHVTDMVSEQQKADLQIIMKELNDAANAADASSVQFGSLGRAADDISAHTFAAGGTFPTALDYSVLRSKVMVDSIHHNLIDAKNIVANDAQALSDAMKNPLSGPERIKQIKDELTGKNSVGKQLIKGLKDSDPLVREAAQKLQQDLKDELKGLAIEYAVNFSAEHKGDTPHHASGGFAPAGELAMFGEQGPELGIPGSGGYNILTAAQTRNVLNGGSGGQIININIAQGAYIDGPSVDRLARIIAQRMRLSNIV